MDFCFFSVVPIVATAFVAVTVMFIVPISSTYSFIGEEVFIDGFLAVNTTDI